MDYGRLRASLEKLLERMQQNDIPGLRQLASELGEEALLEDERAFVEVAVAAYSTSKFLEKPHVLRSPQWKKIRQNFLKKTGEALEAAEKGDGLRAGKALSQLVAEIDKASRLLGRFQASLVQKARIKIATDVYAHGASLGSASQLTGADKRQLLGYIGSTKLAEKYATLSEAERLKKAAKLFE